MFSRIPFAPFSTQANDYLHNIYYAATPFEVAGFGKAEFRLVPVHRGKRKSEAGTRKEKLSKAVENHQGLLRLEIRKSEVFAHWKPLLSIELEKKWNASDEHLMFSPFHEGKGIHPRGFVNYIRKFSYAASRAGRELH